MFVRREDTTALVTLQACTQCCVDTGIMQYEVCEVLYSVQYSRHCTEGHSWAPVHLLATHCPLGSTEAAGAEASGDISSARITSVCPDTGHGAGLERGAGPRVTRLYRALLSTRSGDSVGVGEQRGLTTLYSGGVVWDTVIVTSCDPGPTPYQNIIKVEQHMSERTEIVLHVMSAVPLQCIAWGNIKLVVNLIQFIIVTFEFV